MDLIKDMWKMAINCLGSNKVQGGQILQRKFAKGGKMKSLKSNVFPHVYLLSIGISISIAKIVFL